MGRSDPQGEEDDSVQQGNSQQTMHFWSDEVRHLPTRPPAHTSDFAIALQNSHFLAFSHQDELQREAIDELFSYIQQFNVPVCYSYSLVSGMSFLQVTPAL